MVKQIMQAFLKKHNRADLLVKFKELSNRLIAYIKRHPRRASLVLLGILLVLSFIIVSAVSAPELGPEAKLNYSSNDLSWLKIPGSKLDKNGLKITGLGWAIVDQDGGGGYPNPPVSLTGPHFEVSGDFVVTLSISDAHDTGAYIDLYASPPVIYDEWRLETPRLRLSIKGGFLGVQLWDGSSEVPATDEGFAIPDSNIKELGIESSGGRLTFYNGYKQLGNIESAGVFDSGKVWIGADAEAGNSWLLNSFKINKLKKGNVQLVNAPSFHTEHSDPQTLRNLAPIRGLKIGAAVSLGPLMSNDSYRATVAGQFDMLTPENAMKAQFIHPQPDAYSFDAADALVDFAKTNDMQVHGHALVFGEANPRWMQELPMTDRRQRMIDHISKIMEHYKGKVAEWDVINEPLADSDTNVGLRQSIWFLAMGESFIDDALMAARAADGNAKLYINEFGLEADGERWQTFITLLNRLKSRGVPIDGVGFQSHVYEKADHIDPTVLRTHIKQLADMGILSRISEIDVYGDNEQEQAEEYADVLGACLAEPTCTSFSTWGISDFYGSTTEIRTYPPEIGNDLLWDQEMKPKPAYRSLCDVLKTKT